MGEKLGMQVHVLAQAEGQSLSRERQYMPQQHISNALLAALGNFVSDALQAVC